MSVTLALLGDVMLGRGVADRLAEVSPEQVWSEELASLCASCDAVICICNLECCISERRARTRRVPRKPFFFRGPPAGVESLEAIGVRAVSLANNHALAYRPAGSEAVLGSCSRPESTSLPATPPTSSTGSSRSRGGQSSTTWVTPSTTTRSTRPAQRPWRPRALAAAGRSAARARGASPQVLRDRASESRRR